MEVEALFKEALNVVKLEIIDVAMDVNDGPSI
jgi:hypothetical protein